MVISPVRNDSILGTALRLVNAAGQNQQKGKQCQIDACGKTNRAPARHLRQERSRNTNRQKDTGYGQNQKLTVWCCMGDLQKTADAQIKIDHMGKNIGKVEPADPYRGSRRNRKITSSKLVSVLTRTQ